MPVIKMTYGEKSPAAGWRKLSWGTKQAFCRRNLLIWHDEQTLWALKMEPPWGLNS